MFLFLSIVCASYFLSSADALNNCDRGPWIGTECKKLSECSAILPQLPLLRNAQKHRFLMSATCDFELNSPKVCCPKDKSQKQPGKVQECGIITQNRNLYSDGKPAEENEFPWTVLLEYETPTGNRAECGGALISDRYVLTAADCLMSMNKLTGVRVNDISRPDKFFVVGIEQQIIHEHYNAIIHEFTSVTYNVALLKLNQSVTNDRIKPICLPTGIKSRSMTANYLLTVWGANERTRASNSQSIVERISMLRAVDKQTCENWYLLMVREDEMCALPRSTRESSFGVDGTPLMSTDQRGRMTVVGINLRFFHNAEQPSIFVDVSQYKDWILSHME